MTWYPDLGTETMVASGDHVRAVGWLSSDEPYPTGDVPSNFVARLRLFTERAWKSGRPLGFGAFGGVHRCELCHNNIGTANFGVPSGEVLYVAPEMISHYVEEHDYAPPTEFIAAVMACPLPGTTTYTQLAEPFNRLQREWMERLRQERVVQAARWAFEQGGTEEAIREASERNFGDYSMCDRIRACMPTR